MTHHEFGPELRQIVQTILDRLDPVLQAAAARAADEQRQPGACQQVWCPVCALAALASGEQHPLLSVVAEHGGSLMAALRAMASEQPGRPEADTADPDSTPTAGNGRYHHIPIVVEPAPEPEPDPDATKS